jgi:hypothetical protein
MSTNLKDKFNTGLKPQEFIEAMSVNKAKFLDWYEQFTWDNKDDEEFFLSLKDREDVHCLILAADWCGDVIRNVPVVFRALEVTGISTEVLIMEENLDVMDQFLTMGGRAIPIVLFVDKNGLVLGQWGPRPQHVQEVMVQFKEGNPDRDAPDYSEKIKEVYAEMLKQYGEGTDYQHVIIKELHELLSSI